MLSARSGMIIPVVTICLIVMAILGVVLMTNATSQYMQTAKAAAGLKMREIALGALEEATAVAYDRLSRPPTPSASASPPPWHKELLDALNATSAPGGVLVKHDLKSEGLLPRTQAIVSSQQCEIASASVELLGFKRLSVESSGLFEDAKVYYRDPDGKLDLASDPKLNPVKEWIGSMRLRVTARSDRSSRTLTKVADVKVVDVAPPAREFVLFSFLSASKDQARGPESDDFYQNDLRRGGPVRLFAHGTGRIFVRGPFLVDTAGYPGGQGGKRPPRTASYSPTAENEWWGWHQVPSTHDGIVTRAGPAVVNFAIPPMRPDTRDEWRLFKGLVTERLGSAFADWFDDDPGYYILNGQRWYSESTTSDAQMLSIVGDPVNGQMEPFRGVLVTYENGQRTPHGSSEPLHQGASLSKPPDEDKRWVVEPEGGLYGVYNVVEYYGDTILKGTYQEYSLTGKGRVIGRLGLHWEKCYELGWFNQFVIDLISGGTIFAPLGVIPTLLISRAVAEDVTTTLASWVGVDWSHRNMLTDLSGITPDRLTNALPPGYRPPARAQTRRYPSLKGLVTRLGQQPVLLDGVIGFDDLSCDRPIAYVGRGMFYSEQVSAPTLTAPISSPIPDDPVSYLAVHHAGPVAQAHRGGAMLNINPGSGPTVNAAIYATQGVKPSGAVRINGSLTCGYLNKSQIPGGASLSVIYRPPPATPLVTAVSARTALALDR